MLKNLQWRLTPRQVAYSRTFRHTSSSVCIASSVRTSGALPLERYAIIGAGFAGLATVYHILSKATSARPIQIDVFECAGVGAGASGAAAGLLHPYSPNGKLLQWGEPAFKAAQELVAAAEAVGPSGLGTAPAGSCDSGQFVWRQDLMRLAQGPRQARLFREAEDAQLQRNFTGSTCRVSCLSAAAAVERLPGLTQDALQRGGAALLVQGGLVLHSGRYMRALWQCCESLAGRAGEPSRLRLVREEVSSLAELDAQRGPYHAVVVAAGAAAGTIAEIGERVPLSLSQGYTLDLVPPTAGSAASSPAAAAAANYDGSATHAYPAGAPSMLGETYWAAQGPAALLVGATKTMGYTPAQALAECGRAVDDEQEVSAAAQVLQSRASALWAPSAEWRVAGVRTGVRALPRKTADGRPPLAGRLEHASGAGEPSRWWLLGGLGARGLLYHAWLGKLVAEAAMTGDESQLPAELIRWRDREH